MGLFARSDDDDDDILLEEDDFLSEILDHALDNLDDLEAITLDEDVLDIIGEQANRHKKI